MTTIQKTIRIPPDHRVLLDLALPQELPAGEIADIVVTISPKRKSAPQDSILDLAGALANSKTFSEDSVEMIRKVRDEW